MDTSFLILALCTALLVIAAAVLLIQNGRIRDRLEETERKLENNQIESLRLLQQLNEENRMIWDRMASFPSREEFNSRLEDVRTGTEGTVQAQTVLLIGRLDGISARLDSMGLGQEQRLRHIGTLLDEKLALNEKRISEMRDTLFRSVQQLQDENGRKLEEMRQTVDEKLHATLDKRLSESFAQVSKRLEEVYSGLGEMRSLAGGVGDLKRVLSNVKTRGTWGEVQLGSLLGEMLAPSQYETNCSVDGSDQRVEYAVHLPGGGDTSVLLPIDAKFPIEDYQRLLSARENGEAQQAAQAEQALVAAIRNEAKRISGKYIRPPQTTDFAILFLPLEGLYAEVLQNRTLSFELQEKYRILIAGPTTLSALLTSFQIGFRTVAIEKRSVEVWQLLSAVKNEFNHYSELLETAQKRIRSAGDTLEMASRQSRGIQKKIRAAEMLDLPSGQEADAAALPEDSAETGL